MSDVARMIREHFDGVMAWVYTRQTNGFLEAIDGLFQDSRILSGILKRLQRATGRIAEAPGQPA
jgi:hypothetical protein